MRRRRLILGISPPLAPRFGLIVYYLRMFIKDEKHDRFRILRRVSYLESWSLGETDGDMVPVNIF
jgi:hypothetical protein